MFIIRWRATGRGNWTSSGARPAPNRSNIHRLWSSAGIDYDRGAWYCDDWL